MRTEGVGLRLSRTMRAEGVELKQRVADVEECLMEDRQAAIAPVVVEVSTGDQLNPSTVRSHFLVP